MLVAGGGLAGLTLARCLKRLSIPVRVLEATGAEPAADRRPDRGLGLWPASTAVLRAVLEPGEFDALAHRTPAAAYRGRDGTWLSGGSGAQVTSGPSFAHLARLARLGQHCAEPPGTQHVATVRQAALLEALAGGLEPRTELRYGARVVGSSLRPGGGALCSRYALCPSLLECLPTEGREGCSK